MRAAFLCEGTRYVDIDGQSVAFGCGRPAKYIVSVDEPSFGTPKHRGACGFCFSYVFRRPTSHLLRGSWRPL